MLLTIRARKHRGTRGPVRAGQDAAELKRHTHDSSPRKALKTDREVGCDNSHVQPHD